MGLLSKLRSLLAASQPQTAGYVAMGNGSLLTNIANRPPFSLLAADLMRFDHRVSFGLSIRNGPLHMAEARVTGEDPAVCQFVSQQIRALWDKCADAILATKIWGFQGFEVMYKWDENERLVFSDLLDFHPRDTRPLIRGRQIVGLTVRGMKKTGKTRLMCPKGLWLNYGDEFGRAYGVSILEPCYEPWFDKTTPSGARDLRRLRMQKDAWVGDVMYYPHERIFQNQNGTVITGKDIAREMIEYRSSGAVMAIPDVRDAQGNRMFEYMGPSAVQGATEILNYSNELDAEILEGLGVPNEVVEALSSGSGFSGRSVPLLIFLLALQKEYKGYLDLIDAQMMRPLVALNFGRHVDYRIEPVPLVDLVSKALSSVPAAEPQPSDRRGIEPTPTQIGRNSPPIIAGGRQPQAPSLFGRNGSPASRQLSDDAPRIGMLRSTERAKIARLIRKGR